MGWTVRGWQATGALALAVLAASPATARASAGAGVATAIMGQVTVAHAASPAPQPLRFKDEVFLRDRTARHRDAAEHAIPQTARIVIAAANVDLPFRIAVTSDHGMRDRDGFQRGFPATPGRSGSLTASA